MSPRANETIIELKKVSKVYGVGDTEHYALREVSLSIKRGEFIMIMGPSGCGKTTMLNIIGLLDKAYLGDYKLANKSVEKISARKKARIRAEEIGFIFQDFNLISDLTVLDNVSLPLIYSGVNKTRRLKMADKILERFHLRDREYYFPTQLSGGQQQRAAIARSLVANPSIILADEPTGNLDSRSAHIIMEELKDIHSLGNTIIMVTHNPSLTSYATRVINMLDGEIDTDIKTVLDRDLPRVDDPNRISTRILQKKLPQKKDKLQYPDEELEDAPLAKTSHLNPAIVKKSTKKSRNGFLAKLLGHRKTAAKPAKPAKEAKKPEPKKAEPKKSEVKKPEAKKPEVKKAEVKKPVVKAKAPAKATTKTKPTAKPAKPTTKATKAKAATKPAAKPKAKSAARAKKPNAKTTAKTKATAKIQAKAQAKKGGKR